MWTLINANAAAIQAIAAVISIFAVIIVAYLGNRQAKVQRREHMKDKMEIGFKVLVRCCEYLKRTIDIVNVPEMNIINSRLMYLDDIDISNDLLIIHLLHDEYSQILDVQNRLSKISS